MPIGTYIAYVDGQDVGIRANTADITYKINDRTKVTLKSEETRSFGESSKLQKINKIVIETVSTTSQSYRMELW